MITVSTTQAPGKDLVESNHENTVSSTAAFPSPTNPYVHTKDYFVGERGKAERGEGDEPNIKTKVYSAHVPV